ncbi:MAG: VOC family protein [Thermotogaceae bacterium]|nr:VOC family protein [Thermotogaceae bacterium]HCI29856.1 lactoylglutathione lyase [Fervidobacterium sp.]
MKVHHVGYAVKSIEDARKEFELLGFRCESETVLDNVRKVRILFMTNDTCRIELIEPNESDNPIESILKKVGSSPYHICYESEDIENDARLLKEKGFRVISDVSEAPALGNKNVCFLYSKDIGIIELVQEY